MASLAARIPGAEQRRERFGGRALAHHRRRPRRFKAATFDTLLSSRLRRGLNPRGDITWFFARWPTATHQTVANFTQAAFANLQAGATCAPRVVRPAA